MEVVFYTWIPDKVPSHKEQRRQLSPVFGGGMTRHHWEVSFDLFPGPYPRFFVHLMGLRDGVFSVLANARVEIFNSDKVVIYASGESIFSKLVESLMYNLVNFFISHL